MTAQKKTFDYFLRNYGKLQKMLQMRIATSTTSPTTHLFDSVDDLRCMNEEIL